VPLFRYKALSNTGEALDGQMEAANADEVIVRLQDLGHLPVEARRADAGGEGFSLAALTRKRELDDAQILQFTQQLATLLGAGQPLDRALGILLDLPEATDARKVIERIREAVRGGAPLSTALEQQHGLFSRLYVSLVRAGEAGGGLQDSLRRLADYLTRARELQAQVINALIYPLILAVMIAVSVVFLLLFVVPKIGELFAGLDAELQWYTVVVLFASRMLVGYWWVGLGLVVAGLAMLGRLWGQPAWRRSLDEKLLRWRATGSLVARFETARLARTLGTLLGNGVPLLAALNLGRNVLSNRVLAEALEVATSEVKTGAGLGYALGRTRVYPRLAVQMIQVGEESGELDTMLMQVADTFDVETRNALQRLIALLLPVLTVVMTVVIGIIVISILLPIYDLTGSLG
jgi:general secretion pathway protein F